jgi:MFS family permease
LTAPAAPKHDSYAALRYRDFRWYTAGLFAMTLASQLQAVVVGWQMYELTNDTLALGLIGLAEAIPVLGFALPAGYIVDRFNRKTIALISLVLLTACSVSLLLLSMNPVLLAQFGARPIYAVVFMSGFGRAAFTPARQAMSSEIVPRDVLPNAIAWRSSTWQTAAVAGPALGGLLYGFAGARASYAVDSALMVASFLAMSGVRYQAGEREPMEASVMTNLLVGVRYVFSEPVILAALSLDLFSVFLGGAEALLPVFAKEILRVGPQGLGVLRAAPAVGAVVMGFYVAHRPPFEKAGRMLLVSVALFAACIVGFGLSRNFWLSLVLLAASGMFDAVSVVIRSTLVQLFTPIEMMGRVSAVNSIFIGSSNELGAFESGVAARLLGTVRAVVLGGFASLLVVGATARLVPRLRTLGKIQ